MPPVYTPAEVAALLRLSTNSVYRLINDGRLAFARPGGRALRISQASLLACMKERQRMTKTARGYTPTPRPVPRRKYKPKRGYTRLSAQKRAAVRRMHAIGMSVREIAAQAGCSKSQVWNITKECKP